MRSLFGIALCVAACLALLTPAPVAAAPCSCQKICCIGPHNPGITCETACCTLSGWTTCGDYGTPGCSPPQLESGNSHLSERTWLDPTALDFSQPEPTSARLGEAETQPQEPAAELPAPSLSR